MTWVFAVQSQQGLPLISPRPHLEKRLVNSTSIQEYLYSFLWVVTTHLLPSLVLPAARLSLVAHSLPPSPPERGKGGEGGWCLVRNPPLGGGVSHSHSQTPTEVAHSPYSRCSERGKSFNSEILYSGKISREKTLAVLWLFAKVFSTKFGSVASFGAAKASNP